MLRPSAFILRRGRVAVNRLSNRRANVLAVRTQRRFASGATETAETRPFAVSATNRANSPSARGRAAFHHGLLEVGKRGGVTPGDTTGSGGRAKMLLATPEARCELGRHVSALESVPRPAVAARTPARGGRAAAPASATAPPCCCTTCPHGMHTLDNSAHSRILRVSRTTRSRRSTCAPTLSAAMPTRKARRRAWATNSSGSLADRWGCTPHREACR
jgi:hypothetical protein